MDKVISAGGLVTYENTLLMLRKKNGDWVLPKGRTEKGESLEITAVREVKEETNIDGIIDGFIGTTQYTFCNNWTTYNRLEKIVHWYKMTAQSFHTIAQQEEGYVEAKFIPFTNCIKTAKYKEDKEIITKMFAEYFDS